MSKEANDGGPAFPTEVVVERLHAMPRKVEIC